MKISQNNSQFMVIDDFLPGRDWEEVWKYMQLTTYMYIGEGAWNGAWRLDDGNVMRGPSVSYGQYEGGMHKYPTGSGIDCLVKSIVDNGKQFTRQLGEPLKDWIAFTALPMLYTRETGLYWHRDSPNWAGSYTYYVHKEWNVEWGGALLVADESLKAVPEEYGIFFSKKKKAMGIPEEASFGAHMDNSEANELLMERGMGSYIMPKPNRLVIISGGNAHSVSKVNPAAGDKLRASISGFFQRPAK